MSESPLAIGISVTALITSVITLWFNRLRGPSIKPVKSDEECKIIIQDEVNTPLNVAHLSFNLRATLANNSGSAGIIRNPKISFTPDSDLYANSTIKMEGMSLEPAAKRAGYNKEIGRSYTVPPFSVSVVSFDCRFQLMKWDQVPVDHFVRDCNLKQIQLDYFESNRKKLNELITKMSLNDTLGKVDVTLMVTEKSFPIFGSMKWKERKFVTDCELVISEKSTSSIRQKIGEWMPDINYARDSYQRFLDYVEDQSRAIVQTMEKKTFESFSAFPDDRGHKYASETLSRKDPEFASLWNEVCAYKQTFETIVRTLKAQSRGYQLTESDQTKIQEIHDVLVRLLNKTGHLRNAIDKEFSS